MQLLHFSWLLAMLISPLLAKDLRTTDLGAWYDKGTPNFDYDCTGKPDGNYPHPDLCTHYVACVNETQAYEMACAMNNNDVLLHFVVDQGHDSTLTPCDLPDVAKCGTKPPPPTTTTTTTTLAPPPDPEFCDPNKCQLEGYCQDYRKCVENSGGNGGHWEAEKCGQDLFWNAKENAIHGGVCDYWGNLDADTQYNYSCDSECINVTCAWIQDKVDECSPNYLYRKAFDGVNIQGRITRLSCPQPAPGNELLYWNQNSLTCDKCSRVTKADGSPCHC